MSDGKGSVARRNRVKLRGRTIELGHGAGGKAMRDLIDAIFVELFDNPLLAPLQDHAEIDLHRLAQSGDRLAFTTDSYVVDPLFFPGGDIGRLAVNGTVNDLAVGGASPLYLTCSVIIEEGLPLDTVRDVATSMQFAARNAGVCIVTGDTKVVPHGAADKLFINTTGLGVIPEHVQLGVERVRAGDVVLVNGYLGDHGAAVLAARGDLGLDTSVVSDCQPLHELVHRLLGSGADIRCLRDATRGGLAAVVNEFAENADVCFRLQETALPVREEVKGVCELLGLDPMYFANEGKLVAVVSAASAETALQAMRELPAGEHAAIIGEVTASPAGVVIMKTGFGGERIVDMLVGEQLPRIC